MKVINRTCKFCGKPIDLKIDDSYAELGDPFKLVPYAACNDCADIRVKRRVLSNTLIRVAALLVRMTKSQRELHRQSINEITQKYVQMVNEWTKNKFAWDPAITDAIIRNPESIGDTLSRVWPNYKPACET